MSKMFSYLSSAAVTLFAILLLCALLFPLFWILSSSIRPYSTLFTTEFRLIPKDATLEAYHWVLFESKFFLYAKNSMIVYGAALFSSLLVTIPAAYGFSRFKFLGRDILLNSYFVLAQIMSGMSIIGLLGLYLFLVKIGLANSRIIVGLIYGASTVPYVTWYLKTYFDSIPLEYDEAAFLDGASFLQNILHVIVPIAKPGIFVAVIFISIFTWSEWVIAGILLGSGHFTLPVALTTLQGRWETPWNRFAAMSILYSIPLVILFMLSRHHIEKGMSASGLKG